MWVGNDMKEGELWEEYTLDVGETQVENEIEEGHIWEKIKVKEENTVMYEGDKEGVGRK